MAATMRAVTQPPGPIPFLFLSGQPIPVTVREKFACAMNGMRQAIAANHMIAAPMMLLITFWLQRRQSRVMALVAMIQSGRYRARPSRSGQDSDGADTGSGRAGGAAPARRPATIPPYLADTMRRLNLTVAPRMPRAFGALTRLGSYHAAAFANHLRLLLSEPEMQAAIAAAPGPMGRLLRPLCHALGIEKELLPPPGRPATHDAIAPEADAATAAPAEDTASAALEQPATGASPDPVVEPDFASPAETEPAGVEPARIEPAGVEPAGVEPGEIEPTTTEPAKESIPAEAAGSPEDENHAEETALSGEAARFEETVGGARAVPDDDPPWKFFATL